jgi:hypothetical protein
MLVRGVGAISCLSLLLCWLAGPPPGAGQERSSAELGRAQSGRAELVRQAAAAIAGELERRSVRPVAKKTIAADALRIARSLSDEQLAALGRGGDGVRRLADQQLAARRAAPRAALTAVTAAATIGDPESDLLFVPLPPCRIIDTRFAGGKMAPSEKRDFEVAGTANFEAQGGNPGGCGVPLGATEPEAAAVAINFIAVEPGGGGHLVAWEFNQTEPFASIINYANVGLNIANGVIVPIAGVSTIDKDLSIRAAVSPTHVVADVTGYFTRFPVGQFEGGLKSQVVIGTNTTLVDLGDGGCHQLLTEQQTCTVTAPAAGNVLVEAWSQVVVGHTMGTADRFIMQIETANPVTCPADDTVNASDYEIPDAVGTNADVDFTLSHGRTFPVSAGQNVTYRLSGKMVSGASSSPPDQVENSRLICTFIPD